MFLIIYIYSGVWKNSIEENIKQLEPFIINCPLENPWIWKCKDEDVKIYSLIIKQFKCMLKKTSIKKKRDILGIAGFWQS